MGFFSKCCAKSKLPVVASWRKFPPLDQVVVLLPDGSKLAGQYDGYGMVDDEEISDLEASKFVLASKYAGERYEDLPESMWELGQGYFMADEFLNHCMEVGSFKNEAAYKKAFKKLAGW
jgi:hypothetical protein